MYLVIHHHRWFVTSKAQLSYEVSTFGFPNPHRTSFGKIFPRPCANLALVEFGAVSSHQNLQRARPCPDLAQVCDPSTNTSFEQDNAQILPNLDRNTYTEPNPHGHSASGVVEGSSCIPSLCCLRNHFFTCPAKFSFNLSFATSN